MDKWEKRLEKLGFPLKSGVHCPHASVCQHESGVCGMPLQARATLQVL